MTYRKNTIWNRPIPRVFGIFVLLFSLLTIFWLSGNVVLFGAKAALGNNPKDIQVSNITDKSLTVSFVTDSAVNGTLSYGTSTELGDVALDIRDKESPSPQSVHFITLNNLNPNTKYFFTLASGDGIFKNGEIPFEITTAKTLTETPQSPTTVSGTVTLDGNLVPEEAIAYLKTTGSQTISALIKSDGSYSIELKNLLKEDLSGQVDLKPESKLELRIVDPKSESNISTLLVDAASVPPVILSKNYDFTQANLSTATSSESAQITGFPIPVGTETAITGPAILTPKSEQKFSDQQPLFEGKAEPGADVEITIESDPIVATVQSDENGNWEFRPDTKLEPGTHKITIKTLDINGILKTITRSFTVQAQGSQFTEPSVSPTQKPTVAPSPTPTVPLTTATPSASPTSTTAPTPTVSPTAVIIVPTSIQVTVPVTSPTPIITTPPIPDSGSSVLLFGLTGISILIGIGSLLFFLL